MSTQQRSEFGADLEAQSEAIVVTGISAWTPYGRGIETLVEAIRSERCETSPVRGIDTANPWYYAKHARSIAPQTSIVSNFDACTHTFRPHMWPAWMAVETALDAVVAAGAPHHAYAPDRIAISSGTSHGSNHGLIEYLEHKVAEVAPDASLVADTTAMIARTIGLRTGSCGPNLTFNTACSSGINALGQALRMLRSGRADCVIAGAHDTFSVLSFTGFSSLKALDAGPCRPFDIDRAGLTLGDGAAYLVLERRSQAIARGATPIAELSGYGYFNEGYHTTAPHPEGAGALAAMRQALQTDPGPNQLSLVCAHGTGTRANDGAEAQAVASLASVIKPDSAIDIVSLKSQLGHSLGGAGAVQTIATIACMQNNLIPGNIGLKNPIPHGPQVAFPTCPRAATIQLALCNALGFAGSVASLAIRNVLPEEQQHG